MNRAEHLAWAKTRALEFLDRGEVAQTSATLMSDLSKHPETVGLAREGGTPLMKLAVARDVDGMRQWIEALA